MPIPTKTQPRAITPIDLGTSLATEKCSKISLVQIKEEYEGTLAPDDTIELEGVSISLTTSSPYFGGYCLWFQCPNCDRRCGIVYVHPYGYIGCRICLNLTYPQQRYKGMLENEIFKNHQDN